MERGMQFETVVENADKIHISDSKLNVLCRTIADNIIKYKQSLSPEELDAWNKKAEELNKRSELQKAGTVKVRKTKTANRNKAESL